MRRGVCWGLCVFACGWAGSACATLAQAGGGDEDLPSANVGPFRALRADELGLSLVAPNAIDGPADARAASVLREDEDPDTLATLAFVEATVGVGQEGFVTEIRRTRALDGRSFDRMHETVLVATEGWEGEAIGAPSALDVDGEIWLFYAAKEGIGLARSADGIAFEKHAGPVLAAPTAGWDAGAVPRSPGVLRAPDGSWSLFYEADAADGSTAIGEARSTDGLVWQRTGAEPVIARGLAGDAGYDAARVGAPAPFLSESATGRTILRVAYAAVDGEDRSTIALAGRTSPEEAFVASVSPVFGAGTTSAPTEPCLVPFSAGSKPFSLLFVTQHRSRTSEDPAIAVGVAPADAALPPATVQ